MIHASSEDQIQNRWKSDLILRVIEPLRLHALNDVEARAISRLLSCQLETQASRVTMVVSGNDAH